MSIRFLIDENMTSAILRAAVRYNRKTDLKIFVTRVGESDAPQKGASDPELLRWCEGENCILLSFDKRTLPEHFSQHLMQGHHCPGIFIFKPSHRLLEILDVLALTTHASDPSDWLDRIYYID